MSCWKTGIAAVKHETLFQLSTTWPMYITYEAEMLWHRVKIPSHSSTAFLVISENYIVLLTESLQPTVINKFKRDKSLHPEFSVAIMAKSSIYWRSHLGVKL